MRNDTTQHTPDDVRERVAKAVYLWEATRFGAAESWALRSWEQESNTRRELYFNVADRILSILRTPRGEGERVQEAWSTVEAAALAQANVLDSHYGGQPARAAEIRNAVEHVAAFLRAPRGEGEAWPGDAENDASFLRSWARYLRTEAQDIREAQDLADWKQQAEYTEVAAARMDQIANRIAALRSDAQGEDTIPVSALRSEIALLRKHRLLPYLAWARLCALAGGVPVGEDTPAATRSEVQGEDQWEDLIFSTLIEAYNEAQRVARRGEGGGE